MASITIHLGDDLKRRLRAQAAEHGRSLEEEARTILRAALAEPAPPADLARAIRDASSPWGAWNWTSHRGDQAASGDMQEVSAREARKRFGQLLDAAQGGPVCITRRGRAAAVMMSMEQYQRLQGAAWARLTETMDRLGAEAVGRGLTGAGLDALLDPQGETTLES